MPILPNAHLPKQNRTDDGRAKIGGHSSFGAEIAAIFHPLAYLQERVGVDGGGQHHGDLVEELHVVAEGHVEEPGPRAHQQVAHVGQGVPVRGGRERGRE